MTVKCMPLYRNLSLIAFLFLDCEVDPSIGSNGNVNCTTVGTTRICRPFCNTNYDFDTVAYLDAVVCGLETGFVWNIKSPVSKFIFNCVFVFRL